MLPRVNLIRTEEQDYLLFSTPDIISTNIVKFGTWGWQMNRVSRFICDHNQSPLVIDIGANLGAYSIPLAMHLDSKNGRIYSFEPQRIVYYQLCGNVFLNRLDNVYAHNLAVGDVEEYLEIPKIDYEKSKNIGGFSFGNFPDRGLPTVFEENPVKDSIKKIRLDDFDFQGLPCLLKIDVEGFELEVLKGAAGLLEKAKFPPIIMEIWSDEWFKKEREALLNYLQELGYLLTYADDEVLALNPAHPIQFKASSEKGVIGMQRVR